MSNDEFYWKLYAANAVDLKILQDTRNYCMKQSNTDAEEDIYTYDLGK
jgi:hypothetical protein